MTTTHLRWVPGPRGFILHILICFYFVLTPAVQGELDARKHVAGIDDIYTAKGELELYTGIDFPVSASNFYCYSAPSSKLTIIARFDIPSEDMVALTKHSPKIPMPSDTSINSDFKLYSVIEPYQDQAWFADVVELDYLLSGRCYGGKGKETWESEIFASFVDDQTLRVYLIYCTSNKVPPSKEMYFYTGIDIQALVQNYQLLKEKVGLYKKTLNTSIRFDLPKRDGLEFIETIKSRFHFEESHNLKRGHQYLQKLSENLEIFSDDTNIIKLSKKVLIGRPSSSLRFDVSMAAVVFKDETLCFYFDFYEKIGFRNKIEDLGSFLGIHLSSNVRNVQYHLIWRGDGRMFRFDVPKMELRGILSQLRGDSSLSVLKKGEKLKDRITENHGVEWWSPEQMHDMKWCIKNNGTLFISAGTIKSKDYATIFAKYYDVGFQE